MKPVHALLGIVFPIAILAACNTSSGVLPATSQHSTSPVTSTAPVVSPNSVQSFQVSIFVPGRYLSSTSASASQMRRPASKLHPEYLPTSVNSIAFTQSESGGSAVTGTPQVVTIGSTACNASTGGQTCTATLVGALGQDTWLVQTYVSNNGSGSALSIASLVKTIIAGAANTSSLTLNPILATLAFVPVGSSCNAGSTCGPSLVVNALDAAGATIVGPGNFVNASNTPTPITLSSQSTVTLKTSTSAAATLTLNQTSDNNLAKLAYDGTANGPTTKTITASATGVTSATYTLTLAAGSLTAPATISIGNTNPTSTTIPVSETAYVGPFTETDNCAGIATIGAASGNGPSATFPVTQVGGGTCTVLVADNHSGTASVSIESTTYTVTLQ